MAVTYEIPMEIARTLLNDDDSTNWPDTRLFPKLQQAFREVINRYRLVGIPVLTTISSILTVPTNTLVLNTVSGFPTDLIEPIKLMEGYVGQTTEYMVDMNQRDFLPLVAQDTRLSYWTWQQQLIKLNGALNPVLVLIEYRGNVGIPVFITDVIPIQSIEDYLGHKTASLAYLSLGNRDMGQQFADSAGTLLETAIRSAVKNEIQPLPAKRIAYHRRNSWRDQISGI